MTLLSCLLTETACVAADVQRGRRVMENHWSYQQRSHPLLYAPHTHPDVGTHRGSQRGPRGPRIDPKWSGKNCTTVLSVQQVQIGYIRESLMFSNCECECD